MSDFDFRNYDLDKSDVGPQPNQGEDERPTKLTDLDRTLIVQAHAAGLIVVCAAGHRRLVRDPANPGPCWACKAWERRPPAPDREVG